MGTTMVEYQVTDAAGNVAVCSFNVVVNDDEDPSLSGAGNISTSTDPGICGAVINYTLPTASDNCPGTTVSRTIGPAAGSTFPVGTTTVTHVATDAAGNTDTYSFDVTVSDTEDPDAVCQDITASMDGSGTATITAADVDGGSTDNCTITSMSVTPTTFNSVGTFTVTLTVFDAAGNSDQCTAQVTVEDNNAPTAVCNDITIALDASGNATIVAADIDGGSTDNGTIVSITASQTTFDCSHVGTQTVTLTVTDDGGNSSTCDAQVTVEDNELPSVSCQDITVQLDASGQVSITAADVTASVNDNCAIASTSIDISNFDCDDIGENTVTLTVTDVNGNVSTCEATVDVEDMIVPTITCASVTVNNDGGDCGAIVNFTEPVGLDNCGGVNTYQADATGLSAGDFFPVGTTWLVFAANNAPGFGTATCSFPVTVIDAEAPVINCPSDITVDNDAGICGAVVNYSLPTATDNCAVTSITQIDGSGLTVGDTFPLGTTTLTYEAIDAEGNASQCSFTITVVDAEPPTINCPADINTTTDPGICGAVVNYALPTGNDNCGTAIVTQTDATGLSSGDVFPVGTTTLTYTATDAEGLTNSCSFDITVVDDEAPNAVCQDITIGLDEFGNASIVAADIDGGSTDNCGVTGLAADVTSFTAIGDYTVTLTVTDAAGNTSTCTATVTVEDNNPPTAVCQDITIQLDNSGNVSITGADIDGGSTDNGVIVSVTASQTDFDCSHIGTNTVTLTVTDDGGNSTTCTATVTVEDNIAPDAICQDITVFLDNGGNVSITPADIDNGSSDNCSIASMTLSQSSFDCSETGDNSVTLSVTDIAGNTSTCTATVTVVDNTDPIAVCQDISISLDGGGSATITANDVDGGSSDNCSIVTWDISQDTFTAIGVYPVTLTVTDPSGNTDDCIANVTVGDVTAPTAVCNDITIALDDNGQAVIVAADIDGGSTDNGVIVSITASQTDFDCTHLGTNTVTLTVTDDGGNASTCEATVTVEDNIQPEALCQDITIFLDASGQASITPSDIDNGSNDNCSVTGLALDQTDFDCNHVGGNTVVLTVTDQSGNSSTCSATVTVIDDIPPVITCPANVSVSMDVGACVATGVNLGTPSSNDACGIASASNDAPGSYPLGNTTVTWTVVDVNGNTTTCTQTVTVTDDENPTIDACAGDVTVNADLGDCNATGVDLGNPTVSDPCGIASVVNDAPIAFPVGTTTVTWTITDNNGNTSTCTQVVTVIDNEDPTITSCPGDITVSNDDDLCSASGVALGLPTATDPCGVASINSDAPATFPVGSTTVVWTITDVNGNTSTCSHVITVVDDENPDITCPADIDQPSDFGLPTAVVTVPIPVVADECGIDNLVNDYNGTGDASDTYPVGTTTVTWTVTDIHGNASSCTMNINIVDNQPPEVTCIDPASVNATIGLCETEVSIPVPVATDNEGVASLINDYNGTGDASDTYPVGVTVVTWTATDLSGNTADCTMEVTVIDNEDPTITFCPVAVAVSTDIGFCSASGFDLGTLEATDPCGIAGISNDAPAAFPVGMTIVTWTVVDVNGNSSQCTQEVTVTDDENPTIEVCPADITVNNDLGVCEATIADIGTPVVSDPCGIASVESDALGVYAVGTTEVTWTVTDIYDNVSTCVQTITVIDNESPVIDACASTVTVNSVVGTCESGEIEIGMLSATDNCAIDTIFNDAIASYPVGTTIVTWTVVDIYGNSSQCEQEIIVIDNEDPTIVECSAPVTFNTDPGTCETVGPVLEEPVATDPCGVANITNDAPAVFQLGETIVTWTVVDVNGNTSTCEQVVTIVDEELPVITDCPASVTVTNDPGECSATGVDLGELFAEDNCGVGSIENDAQEPFLVGSTIVTWTVTDVNGNIITCTQEVIVLDEENPSITCPADITQSNDIGECGALVNFPDPEVVDNCGIQSLTQIAGLASGELFPVGSTTVSYEVIDLSGNSLSCSFEVTVTDDENPTIECPEDIITPDSLVNYPYPLFDDNCYAEIMLIEGGDAGTVFEHGNTYVMFAAVDLSGNMDTCGFNVLVNRPPVAITDTLVIFESDGVIDIDNLENDYDPDGDAFTITEILHNGEITVNHGTHISFDIPDNDCGLDSVIYVITDVYGASDTATIYIDVTCYPNVFVPEGFSPNGDGTNDLLHILGLHEYPDNELLIFNRWGHKVYERRDYQNDWNGTSEAALTVGETHLPRGTYFYILDLHSTNIQPLKGFIYINPR